MANRSFLIKTILILIIHTFVGNCEYIQTEELVLNESQPPNSELLDLNVVKNKQANGAPIMFKLIYDTELVNYIFIDEKSRIVLKKKLNYQELCSTVMDASGKCLLSLKIIAVNENDFIEIPVVVERALSSSVAAKKSTTSGMSNPQLQPLDFESPMYTAELTDDAVAGQLILSPLLKDQAMVKNKIEFSLTEGVTDEFRIDTSNGRIYLNQSAWSLLLANKTSNYFLAKKTFIIGFKASYKRLANEALNNAYYFDYVLPAFAKVKVTVKHLLPDVMVKSQILHKSLNLEEETKLDKTQTLTLNLYEPIMVNSKLFSVSFNELNLPNNSINEWSFELNDKNLFGIDLSKGGLTIINRVKLNDLSTYRGSLRLRETNRAGQTILAEVNLVLRVDFDPLIFEQAEYNVHVRNSDILNENLVRVAVKPTQASKDPNRIKYRLNEQDRYFQIDSTTGWLTVREQFDANQYFELHVTATNVEQQKSKSVLLKLSIDCSFDTEKAKSVHKQLTFDSFENSPNQTQIGTLSTICSNLNLDYMIKDSFEVNVCVGTEQLNCSTDYLNRSRFDLRTILDIKRQTGYLVTKNLINSSLFVKFLRINEPLVIASLSIRVEVVGVSKLKTIIYNILLNIHNAPKITNFYKNFHVVADTASPALVEEENCVYNYKFQVERQMANRSEAGYEQVRFVRIDQSSAQHLPAEFKTSSDRCAPNFVIHNNGCLALVPKDLNVCYKDNLLLKAAVYTIEFKLCFYDNNKVSCSPMYSQIIRVPANLYTSGKLSVSTYEDYELEGLFINEQAVLNRSVGFMSNLNSTGLKFIMKNIGTNVYFLIMASMLAVTTVVLVVILVLFKVCQKKLDKQVNAVPDHRSFPKIKMHSESSTANSETSSQLQSSNQTAETSSNALTTSSKISKTDDENEEEIGKIRVSDDFLDSVDKNLSSKYVYTNNNFSYAGSFSSISSSSSTTSSSAGIRSSSLTSTEKVYNKNLSINPNLDDTQGLYSVKNALIRYENTNTCVDAINLKESPYYGTTTTRPTNEINNKNCLLKINDLSEINVCNDLKTAADINQHYKSLVKNNSNIYDRYFLTNKEAHVSTSDIIASIV